MALKYGKTQSLLVCLLSLISSFAYHCCCCTYFPEITSAKQWLDPSEKCHNVAGKKISGNQALLVTNILLLHAKLLSIESDRQKNH